MMLRYVSAPHLVAIGCLLWSCTQTPALASETTDTRTRNILDTIERSRGQSTPAGHRAARQLNAQGNRAYKKHDYRAAFTAYMNSYPNAPNAYAYIMAGDSHWRGALQLRTARIRNPEPSACTWDNRHFVNDLALDLSQHHEVGLALAQRSPDRDNISPLLVRRARQSADCLWDMARDYETQPPTACIDLSRLKRCLGVPLI